MPELDPEILDFLGAEAASMNEQREKFFDRWGFYHDCRCDVDYAEDNTLTVPACWVQMMDTAFDRLALYRGFLKELADEPTIDPDAAEAITHFLVIGRG